MPVKIYDIRTHSYEELTVPESYVFRRKREEVRVDAVKQLFGALFAIEYMPCIGAHQSNFVASKTALGNSFQDLTKKGCMRYLRHVEACRSILQEGKSTFGRRFPESCIPLENIISLFAYELARFN